jgi:hypothetical protein
MKDVHDAIQGQWIPARVPLGAGGYITGFDFSADGSRMMCWADVFGCYVRDKGDDQWHPLFTTRSLQHEDYVDTAWNLAKTLASGIGGTLQGRIAPSNRDRLYASLNGLMYRVDIGSNRNISASRFAMTPQLIAANSGNQRLMAHGVDVDPHDDGIVIFGTNGSGVFYSMDAGRTVRQIAGIAEVARLFRYLVGIDPHDPSHVYIHAQGVGLYRSTSGVAGPFALLPNGPAAIAEMTWLPDGTLFMPSCDGFVWRLDRDGDFGKMAVPGAGWTWGFAIDPGNHDRFVVWDLPKQGMLVSNDRGTTWSGTFATTRPRINSAAGGEVQWYQNVSPRNWSASRIMFDPAVPGRLWMAHGLGIGFTDNVPAGSNAPAIAWSDHSSGIEELVALSHYVNPTSGTAFGLYADQPIWRYNAFDAGYANVPRAPFLNQVYNYGWAPQASQADSAIDDPDFLVAVVGRTDNRMCFSRDDGRTWIQYRGPFPVEKLPPGGCIAVSNSNNVIFVPANNAPAIYTTDATNPDAVWKFLTLGAGVQVDHLVNATWNVRHIVCADKTRPGVFALLVGNLDPVHNAIGRDIAGLWVTDDGGATWRRTIAGVVGLPSTSMGIWQGQDNRQSLRARLAYIPGFRGEMLYNPHADDPSCPNDRLFWIKDDGRGELKALRPSEIQKLRWFDFGKAAPGEMYPAVYFYATVKGVRGFYGSFDWFATTPRLLIPDYPLDCIDKVSHVAGDMTRGGRFYWGYAASGAMYADYVDAAIAH